MKKIVLVMLLISLFFCTSCKNERQFLPSMDFPLSEDVLLEAMQNMSLLYVIQEDIEAMQGQSRFSLYSVENGELIAGIVSGSKNGERFLSFTFMPFYSGNAISLEESEDMISFATVLFGGFETVDEVYEKFVLDYSVKNTQSEQYEISAEDFPPQGEGASRWEDSIGDITCRIVLEQPLLSESQEFLRIVIFTSDWNTFFSEETA